MGCTDCSHSTLLHFLKQETALTERQTCLWLMSTAAQSQKEKGRKKEIQHALPCIHS